MNMITVKIDVTKVDKARLFEGKNGAKYLDLVLIESQSDRYGNDFMVVQSVTKEERLAGVKGAILGNGKHLGQRQDNRPQGQPSGRVTRQMPAQAPVDDSDPFSF